MNSVEGSEIVEILRERYPYACFDGILAEAFMNSLVTNAYEPTLAAVREWVATVDRFPTIAELNAAVRRLRGDENSPQGNVRQLPSRDEPVSVPLAAAAFERGYRKARTKAGDTEAEIVEKLGAYVRRFPGSIPGMAR